MLNVFNSGISNEIAEAIMDLSKKLSGPDMVEWFAEFRKFLCRKPCWTIETEDESPSIIPVLKMITFSVVKGRETSECFINKKLFGYRDRDLDIWLPRNQPDQSEKRLSVRRLNQHATFKQVIEDLLKIEGDITIFSRLLKERGILTTLPVIESLIERQEAGDDVGLGGRGNFFFVLGKETTVLVVSAYRGDGIRWFIDIYPLDYDIPWCDERRFFCGQSF